MARMVLEGFPGAPQDGWWCTVCTVLAKGSVLARQRELIEAGLADDDRETFTVRAQPGEIAKMLRIAVAHGPALILGGVVVPLCWEHQLATDPNAPDPSQGLQQHKPGGLVYPPGARGGRG